MILRINRDYFSNSIPRFVFWTCSSVVNGFINIGQSLIYALLAFLKIVGVNKKLYSYKEKGLNKCKQTSHRALNRKLTQIKK